ncbi:hypothetical protein K450DRAFT_245554 [Umbelopsis ramanniana AG]|uniref:BHLH domain-containing protein n=1 Tax=Umbelopsis ramanniana AG TaxID=1314678 RepID=A0AAD5HE43_UMBRA|nr:uncharacterized protein K450DRAFT_245554 [Umbelopsis ramanniana AG]KAI8578793.1 hypothetical protein K450DRAFT_245554 [Umbelopsis ramanniana AG]
MAAAAAYVTVSPEESRPISQSMKEPTSEKRMVHNAMERVRRETLNTKFQELAYALPTLRTVRRPSKSQIVQRALEFVRTAFVQEKIYQKQITNLKRENEILIAQLDTIRDKLTNRYNTEAFGIPAKIGDADFVLDDVHATQHAEDEDDQSTESWEYEAFSFGEGQFYFLLPINDDMPRPDHSLPPVANNSCLYASNFMGLPENQSIPQPSTSYDTSGPMAFDIQGFNALQINASKA